MNIIFTRLKQGMSSILSYFSLFSIGKYVHKIKRWECKSCFHRNVTKFFELCQHFMPKFTWWSIIKNYFYWSTSWQDKVFIQFCWKTGNHLPWKKGWGDLVMQRSSGTTKSFIPAFVWKEHSPICSLTCM